LFCFLCSGSTSCQSPPQKWLRRNKIKGGQRQAQAQRGVHDGLHDVHMNEALISPVQVRDLQPRQVGQYVYVFCLAAAVLVDQNDGGGSRAAEQQRVSDATMRSYVQSCFSGHLQLQAKVHALKVDALNSAARQQQADFVLQGTHVGPHVAGRRQSESNETRRAVRKSAHLKPGAMMSFVLLYKYMTC